MKYAFSLCFDFIAVLMDAYDLFSHIFQGYRMVDQWSQSVPHRNKTQQIVNTVHNSWKAMDYNPINTLRPRQNGRLLPDDIFKSIFSNENARISIKISLNFVPKGPINNIPALVQIMAWRRPGDKPLSEPMMVGLPTHICVNQPQGFNVDCLFLLYI